MGAWTTAQTLLAVSAIVLAFGLGYLVRERLSAGSRRAHKAAEKDSEQRLDLVLWSTGDELWEMDMSKDTFIRTNPLKHLFLTNYEVVRAASTLRTEVMPEDRAAFDAALVAHFKGETEYLDISYRARTNDGSWVWLRTRGRVVERSPDGRAIRMLGTTGDITEFKNHELALEQLNQELESRVEQRTQALDQSNRELHESLHELQQAQEQLVHAEKMAALGGLVAGVAHEINTPLGIGVTAASYLEQETRRLGVELEEKRLSAESLNRFRQSALESCQLILRNLMRADKLVKSFKQVAVDQSSEQRRRIDLASYLQEIMSSLHPSLKRTHHRVEIAVPDGIELETCPGALYQIVVNLVLNSLMHGFRDRNDGHIIITARQLGANIVMHYRDDGVGMTDDVRRKIFEPFFTTRRGEGGSGLGMHIVWNLTTQVLQGSVMVESAPGMGTAFEFKFPAITPEPN